MLLLLIDVMLFRKAAYPNPELIPLRQATPTTMLNCDGEQLLKSEGAPWQIRLSHGLLRL